MAKTDAHCCPSGQSVPVSLYHKYISMNVQQVTACYVSVSEAIPATERSARGPVAVWSLSFGPTSSPVVQWR